MNGFARLLFSVILAIGFASAAACADTPRQFKDLKEATAVLDQCLAAHSRQQLLKIVAQPDGNFGRSPALFDSLTREWKRTGPFSVLYSSRKFPVVGSTFKLGGHDSELGHMHIDFKRTEAGWVLDDIWICR
ncbi:hypothetical protein ACXR0O_28565 [Verrucomicrobiota bacterium sgz303538]